MRKFSSAQAAVAALFIGLVVLAAPFLAAQTAKIDIPYQKFTLDNGLTLIVHEDHKAPIVAFNVWYHVGSKNEVAGKTGFAHLFEHLMFNGSENYDDDYFKPMQKIGATDLNGTTNEDRTNYFENVPVSALDLVLWMESDRMGHLKGAISQAKLDEQRGVVQNELRQYQNEPYSVTEDLIIKGTYPPDHPYSWSVGGSIEDLGNAKLEDVHKWFSTYYGPNNAVVVVAGDIDTKTVVEKVKTYFGDIPPSPPVARHSAWVAKRTGSHRQSVQDRVSQARIYKIWNVPGWGTACADKLDLVSSILADGKTSRLYKRLVYDDQLATSVSAYINTREIAGDLPDPGRRPARRRARPGREGHRRGAGPLPQRGPDGRRGRTGQGPIRRPFRQGRRADRRLRRQVRHPGLEHDLRRLARRLQEDAGAHRRRDAREPQGERRSLALRRRLHPRSDALPGATPRPRRAPTARPCQPPGPRPRPSSRPSSGRHSPTG